MKTLTIKWQRLVNGGQTCPRCGDTGKEVRKAAATLAKSLAPLGLKVALKEVKISQAAFERQPLESNRILLNGRPLEEWLGAETGQSPCCGVCGPNDCRTVTVDGESHETVPAKFIVRAGLMAAAGWTPEAKPPKRQKPLRAQACSGRGKSAKAKGCCP